MADLIERGDAINEIEKLKNKLDTQWLQDICMRNGLIYAQRCVKSLPAVNHWISVEDALPEKDKSYFTYAETTKYCTHNEIPEGYRRNILYFDGEEWYDEECRYYNVLFWMPLPEPPESEVQE